MRAMVISAAFLVSAPAMASINIIGDPWGGFQATVPNSINAGGIAIDDSPDPGIVVVQVKGFFGDMNNDGQYGRYPPYWNGMTFQWEYSEQTCGGGGKKSVSWSCTGPTEDFLVADHAYSVAVWAENSVGEFAGYGNAWSMPAVPPEASKDDPLDCGAMGVTIKPADDIPFAVTYANGEGINLCVTPTGDVDVSKIGNRIKNGFKNDVFMNGGTPKNGPCASDSITWTVQSNPAKCSDSGEVRALCDDNMIVGSIPGKILVPTSVSAQKVIFNSRDCRRVPGGATCIYDGYVLFFHGPTGMDLTNINFFESLHDWDRFSSGGVLLPRCDSPGAPPPTVVKFDAPWGFRDLLANGDLVGYKEPPPMLNKTNCGDIVQQDLHVGKCTFQSTHTKQLGGYHLPYPGDWSIYGDISTTWMGGGPKRK